MSVKLSKTLKDDRSVSGIDSGLEEYEGRYGSGKLGGLGARQKGYRRFTEIYYDLVTDFYEYGWGKSFHFAPRVPGESFKESLVRHERFLATRLGLKPGMLAADLGCGIGGPMMEIARFSGAKIVGININGYQIERARRHAAEAGLSDRVEFLESDFLDVDAPDESFDAVYSIEATCCAPDKVSIYGEAFRLLKPGGQFANYEYILTDRFDASDPQHLQIKADIELGGGLLEIDDQSTVDEALDTVGFEVVETRDLAIQDEPSVPWYEPLAGSGISLTGFRRSWPGRWVTRNSLRLMEAVRLAPAGSTRVADTLELCANGMVDAGRLGIFSPMYFIHARKPGLEHKR